MKIAAVLLLLVSSLAWAAPGALDKATFEKYLRHLELFRGDVTFKIDDPKPSKYLPGYSEVLVHLIFNNAEKDELFYISDDGQTIIRGDVFTLGKSPFQSNLDKLTLADQPSFGPADAPVTIVEFGDFECPDCKMEAPILRHDLPAAFDGKVRVVFKNYPLESVHPWARAAAIAGRCVYQQGQPAFWKFYDWIYENQDQITGDNLNAKILAWAGENAVDTRETRPVPGHQSDRAGGESQHCGRARAGNPGHADAVHQWPQNRRLDVARSSAGDQQGAGVRLGESRAQRVDEVTWRKGAGISAST